MAAVQFYGKEAVLTAFDNRGIETWALFSGKNMNFAGIGSDMLSQVLDNLVGSSALYTLAVYNNEPEVNNITNRTENNGAFTFKLDREERSVNGGFIRAGSGSDPVAAEINAMVSGMVRDTLRKKLNGIAENDESHEDSWSDIIKRTVSEKPEVVIGVIGAIKSLLYGAGGGMPASIGALFPKLPVDASVEGVDKEPPGDNDPSERLISVLNRLEACDRDILTHLEQLADIAETNPAMYGMAINMLKAK